MTRFKKLYSIFEDSDTACAQYIEICGSEQVSVNGSQGVCGYTDNEVKLRYQNGILSIQGLYLKIRELDRNHIFIFGKILGLSFLTE